MVRVFLVVRALEGGGDGGLLMGSEEFMWLGKGTEGRWGRVLRGGFCEKRC